MSDKSPFSSTPGILIVDDTPINLQLLATMLADRGFRPRPVSNGAAAIRAAEVEEPDLIILDITMPGMNGYQVCAEIKSRPQLSDIPIIFLSALGENEDKVRALKAGGIDFLTKPFRIEEVEARINTHLKVRLLQKKLRIQNARLEEMVAARTRELDEAYKRLNVVDKLKSEYLVMLSHEMRTPSNGLLGIGELILELCPESEEKQQYADLFAASRDRLLRLLDDTQHLTRLDQSVEEKTDAMLRVSELWGKMPSFLKCIPPLPAPTLQSTKIAGSIDDLQRLLCICEELASCFQGQHAAPEVSFGLPEREVRFTYGLDSLRLNAKDLGSFFDLSSEVRTRSAAERLGLAPVVARRTAEWLGGRLLLVSTEAPAGELRLTLPVKNMSVS